MAGLLGSPHCVAMCGPFALACGGRVGSTVSWHSGKLLTYALLGALAGWLGDVIPGPNWAASVVSGALVVWFAAALAGWAPEPTVKVPGLTRLAARAAEREDFASRFTFGLANGLLPCGLVYATLGMSVASGRWWTGALVMTAFGLGTVPLLSAVALGARRLTDQKGWVRRAVALIVLVAGLWAVSQRSAMGAGGTADHSPEAGTSDTHMPG